MHPNKITFNDFCNIHGKMTCSASSAKLIELNETEATCMEPVSGLYYVLCKYILFPFSVPMGLLSVDMLL